MAEQPFMGGAPEAAPGQQFSSPEEELRYLRSLVAEKEQKFWQEQVPAKREEVVSQAINEYAKAPPPEAEHFSDNPEYETVVAHINSLPHREKMRELYAVLKEKGVLAAIQTTRGLNNPHIESDFHRVLVEYLHSGALIPGLEKETPVKRALQMTLYEVTLPQAGSRAGEDAPRFQDAITAMERLLLGIFPSDSDRAKNYPAMSFELANTNFSSDLVFAVAVPDTLKDLFVKQLLGVFSNAKIEENPGNYNIFNEFGASLGAVATSTNNFVYPIQYVDEAESDPLKVIIGAFSKIERDGEGAAIQFVVTPDGTHLDREIRRAIGKIRDGTPVRRATDIPLTFAGEAVKFFSDFVHTQMTDRAKEKEKEQKRGLDGKAEMATKLLGEKIEHPLTRTQLRIVASAATRERAEVILSGIESAFNQFHRTDGNGLTWKRFSGNSAEKLFHEFTYRLPNDPDETLVFNTKELSTLYHLPLSVTEKEAPQLKTLKAATAPSPVEVPMTGTLLGVNRHRGTEREIRMSKADRLRHFYVIGQTGTGKTSILKNMIIDDIKDSHGVCFIDPHGSDVQDILANIPKERVEDVIYFDPTYMPRPFGLNMLEYDGAHPEQKIFVVNELFSIFKKLYSSTPESMGPAFEQYFRNATMLVLEDPESGMTMLEISRVLADKKFRDLKLSRCKNPIVVQFWRDIAEKTSGESGLANMIPYITNKFDVFLSNDVMRPIIGQEKSSFNFRQIMDTKKIILINLAKGKLGDINANLIGLVLVGKILMAALSRVDSFGKQLPDFYLYIDEFQNITTDSISAILSEARKYGLSLNIAHQYIAQLDEGIKDAVFGNVGSMAVFRVGVEDAQFLEQQFAPIFTAHDLLKIDNYNCYMKMLMNGRPVPPFNLATLPPEKGTPEIVEQLKQLSYLKFGRDRETVDGAIMSKYLSMSTAGKTGEAVTSRLVAAPTSTTTVRGPAPAPGTTPFAQALAGLAGDQHVTRAGSPFGAQQPYSATHSSFPSGAASDPSVPRHTGIAQSFPEHLGGSASASPSAVPVAPPPVQPVPAQPPTPFQQAFARAALGADIADSYMIDAAPPPQPPTVSPPATPQ